MLIASAFNVCITGTPLAKKGNWATEDLYRTKTIAENFVNNHEQRGESYKVVKL